MYLPELVLALACLGALGVDIYLGIRVFAKYVTLPRLLAERKLYLENAYLRARVAELARRKAVNDKIRRSGEKARVAKGKTILFPRVKKAERKAA